MTQRIILIISIFILALPLANCYKPLKVSFVALQVLDTVTTLKGIHDGATEGNKYVSDIVQKSPVLFVAAKAGATIGWVWIMDRLYERSRFLASVNYLIFNSLLSYVVYNNIQVCLRIPMI